MKVSDYIRANKSKLIKTCFCYVSFFGLGGCCTLLGSSLLDLQIRLSAKFSEVSNLVPGRSIGYLIGGLIAGIIDGWFEPNMVLFVTNLTAGIFIAVAPWFTQYSAVYACLLLSGIAQGAFDIYTNTYTLSIWGDQATNYVQILHGNFGLASLLTPLLVKPFLLPLSQNSSDESSSDEAILGDYTPSDVKVQYPFAVVGLILMLNSIGFLIYHFKERNVKTDNQSADVAVTDDYPTWKKISAVLSVALIAHTTFGVETAFGTLAPSFVVKSDLKMSKQDGANMVTMFWTVFTFYRVIFILVSSSIVKEKYMMYFNYILILISIFLMSPSAASNQIIAWISFALLGVGLSPTFSVSLGLLQKYITVTNKYAAIIFIIAAVGEAIHPWIMAKFMDKIPVIFVYYTAGGSFVQILFCFLLPFICKGLFKNQSKPAIASRTASIRSSIR